jgi:carboxypeptidase C (cathepsin A)
MKTMMRHISLLTAAFSLAAPLWSQPRPAAEAKPEAAAQPTPPPAAPKVEEKSSKTEHSLTIGGQTIQYTAVAGTIVLKKDDGTPTASIFYTAYTRDGVTDLSKRPLTFAFNGGPGSSSVWLQMGMLGPKRVALVPDGSKPEPPPYHFVDNEYSILDLTDLVFIDPVSTGYSRAVPESSAKDFHGFTGDLKSVAEFIRRYTTDHSRWGSPKFLAGESYGTTRAGALSGSLQEHLGMNLNGIVLVSSALDFATISFGPGNDLPYALFLPSYAATAWYHKKLPADLRAAGLEKVVDEARRFAGGPYQTALFKGTGLSQEERAAVVKNLARFTGLSPEFIEENNLRVSMDRFAKELLRAERRTVGRYDSRVLGTDLDAGGDRPSYDPSYSAVQGPFTAAFNQYVRGELKFENDMPYEILTNKVWPWSFQEFENRYVNVTETLRDAMSQNPALRVFVACGYFDLATPLYGAEYAVDHMLLDRSLRGHVTFGYYEGGHMLYTNLQSLAKAKQDLAKFYAGALP